MVLSVNRITDTEIKKYDTIDQSLIASKDFTRNFGEPEDYIEAHVYTQNGKLIFSDYNCMQYKVPSDKGANDTSLTNSIEFDAGAYLEFLGYTIGSYEVGYNIYRKKVINTNEKVFFIKEISSDRTEIRLSSNSLQNIDIENGVLNFLFEFQSSPYYKDFLLNFGDNKSVNATNIVLDKNTDPYSVLIKLYQPLPDEFQLKSSCWIVEELSESYLYSVELFPQLQEEKIPFLRQANFDISVKKNHIRPSDYVSINDLFSLSTTPAYQKLINKLDKNSLAINIDYSDYKNFIHFSSAKERLLNFEYKLSLIEGYNDDIASIQTISNYSSSYAVSSSVFTLQNNINNLIQKFDGYESYLYFASESNSWPKSGSHYPYYIYPTTSSQAITWKGTDDYNSVSYGGQLSTASLYDQDNQDQLINYVPEYLFADDQNDQYQLFLNLIGQHFDEIWVYIKGITDLYKNENNLYTGISKDMVSHALKNLGINLYNSNSNDDIFKYLIGSNNQNNYITTSSYETLVTSSQDRIGTEEQHKELLKRVYHNIPLLLKSKGTNRGIKALISTFGIPDTILDVYEYGGTDKSSETIDYSYDRFSYSLQNTGSSYFSLPWCPLTQNVIKHGLFDIVPDTLEFRFKPNKNVSANFSSSLLTVAASGSTQASFGLDLKYTAANYPYADITFYLSGSAGYITSSVTLPVYLTGSAGDTEWYNVMLRRRYTLLSIQSSSAQYYDLFVKNEINGRIGHQASASMYLSPGSSSYNYSWANYGNTSSYRNLYVGGNSIAPSASFQGDLQELRIWSIPVSESAFNAHTLNPESIQGNDSGSAYNDLAARFPLGNNLYVYNHYLTSSVTSVHPDYSLLYGSGSMIPGYYYGFGFYGDALYGTSGSGTGSYLIVVNSGSFFNYPNKINYNPLTEEYFTNTPNTVYATQVNKKVRIVDNLITGSVLSPFLKLEQAPTIELTKDIHLVDISFSPQNEINKDIIAQYGGTINLDNLIGNPRDAYNTSYPDLQKMNAEYLAKYTSKLNLKDYIRLISFFSNTLFRAIKDFIPARSNAFTGITIKSPILERPKIKSVESVVDSEYNYTSSISVGTISADSTYTSSYGNGSDFYNGELSGSVIDYKTDFEERNENPYTTFKDDLNIYNFAHTEFNVLLNNVSQSLFSKTIKKVNFNDPKKLEPVELQETNYTYERHIRPRYKGSKSTSQLYNIYTDGDNSYGKTAAIDYNVEQFAWITQVNERNLNFVDKCSVSIKYLIDASGSTTELSRDNNNLFTVQNIFKSGDESTISLLDSLNPTNQSSLAGVKDIWRGGFSYSPIIYREINETMYFNLLNPSSYLSTSLGIKAVLTSSVVFQTIGDTNTNFTTIPDANTLFKIDGVAQSGVSFSLFRNLVSSWPYSAYIPLNTSGPYKKYDGTTFTDPAPALENGTTYYSYYYTLDNFLPFETGSGAGGYLSTDFTGTLIKNTSGGEKYISFIAPRQSTYKLNVSVPIRITGTNPDSGWSTFKLVGVIEKKNGSTWNYVTKTSLQIVNLPQGTLRGIGIDESHDSIFWDAAITGTNAYIEVNCALANYEISLNQSDEIRLKVFLVEMREFFQRTEDILFTLEAGNASRGFIEVYDTITSTTVPVTTGSIVSSPAIFYLDTDYQTLIFNDSASVFYDNSTFVAPTGSVANNIDIYYSPVKDLFHFETGDTVRFDSYFTTNAAYFYLINIIDPVVSYTGGTPTVISKLKVKLDRAISSGSVSTQHFAFLRPEDDETNVMMDFNKITGKTSAGLLLPWNLEDDIKADVSNIISPLKDKLLSKVTYISG